MCEAEKRWLEVKSKEWKAEGIELGIKQGIEQGMVLNKESNKAGRIIVKKCIKQW